MANKIERILSLLPDERNCDLLPRSMDEKLIERVAKHFSDNFPTNAMYKIPYSVQAYHAQLPVLIILCSLRF